MDADFLRQDAEKAAVFEKIRRISFDPIANNGRQVRRWDTSQRGAALAEVGVIKGILVYIFSCINSQHSE